MQIRHSIKPFNNTASLHVFLVTGAIPKDDGKPNPLDEMSEQEKEEEAEKLVSLIHDLNRRGVIRTAQVGPDGRPQECLREERVSDEASAAVETNKAMENGNRD